MRRGHLAGRRLGVRRLELRVVLAEVQGAGEGDRRVGARTRSGQPVEEEVDLELGALRLGGRRPRPRRAGCAAPTARRRTARVDTSGTRSCEPSCHTTVAESASGSIRLTPAPVMISAPGLDGGLRQRVGDARPCRRRAPATRRCRCRSGGRGSSGSGSATRRSSRRRCRSGRRSRRHRARCRRRSVPRSSAPSGWPHDVAPDVRVDLRRAASRSRGSGDISVGATACARSVTSA